MSPAKREPPAQLIRDAIKTAVRAEITAERRRQMSREGYSPVRDDLYQEGELARAAQCYGQHGMAKDAERAKAGVPADWPWPAESWKPKDWRSDLIRAGALQLAEMERSLREWCGCSSAVEIETLNRQWLDVVVSFIAARDWQEGRS